MKKSIRRGVSASKRVGHTIGKADPDACGLEIFKDRVLPAFAALGCASDRGVAKGHAEAVLDMNAIPGGQHAWQVLGPDLDRGKLQPVASGKAGVKSIHARHVADFRRPVEAAGRRKEALQAYRQAASTLRAGPPPSP